MRKKWGQRVLNGLNDESRSKQPTYIQIISRWLMYIYMQRNTATVKMKKLHLDICRWFFKMAYIWDSIFLLLIRSNFWRKLLTPKSLGEFVFNNVRGILLEERIIKKGIILMLTGWRRGYPWNNNNKLTYVISRDIFHSFKLDRTQVIPFSEEYSLNIHHNFLRSLKFVVKSLT